MELKKPYPAFKSRVWRLFSAVLLMVMLLLSVGRVMAWQQVKSTNPYFRFQNFSKKDGLPSNHILFIFQDKQGFMWFATDRGLSRYDGYAFVTYRHEKDNLNSLSGDIVTCLAGDTAGNMWVGTDKGLDRYIRSNHTFTHVEIGEKGNRNSNYVRAFAIDENNIFWIETADGFLYEMNITTGKYKRFGHEKPGQLNIYKYHNIYQGKNKKLWIGGRSFGPLCFNKKNEKFISYSSPPDILHGKLTKDITCFYQDGDRNFWVAGVDGLYRFDTLHRKFYSVVKGSVFDVTEGRNGKLWIGTGHGLIIWDRTDKQFTTICKDVENPASLPNNHITKLYFDRSGCLWIGTVDGLAKYAFYTNKFSTLFHIPGNPNTLSSSFVTALLEDHNHNIWVGTDDAGIDVFNRDFKKIDHFDTFSSSPLASNRVSVLYEDKKGNIWVGFWSGTGFQKIDRNRKVSRLFRLDTTSRNMDWYNGFCEDNRGNFWVASWSSYGLFRFNHNIFVDKRDKPGCRYRLGSHFVSVLMKDNKGFLWTGSTEGSVTQMNPADGSTIIFNENRDDSASLWGNHVRSVFQDGEGNVWVGAFGLNKFCTEDNSFLHFTTSNGLADNDIRGITEDDAGRLWISTAHGLSLFDKTKDTFANFYIKNGLPDDEFTRAVCHLSDNRLLFGTEHGLVIVHPWNIRFHSNKNIPVNDYRPQPMITMVSVMGEPFPYDYNSGKPIQLDYKQNYVNFTVSVSDYNFPKGNKYVCKLVNFDRKWRYFEASNRSVQYSNLRFGKYYFLLKAANPDGVWSKNPLQITMIIHPPFWETTWFHLLELLFLISLMMLYVLYRDKKLKQKYQFALLQQKLLRTQMNPHFIFNALSAIQSYVLKHDAVSSASYLSKFALLMRSILIGSRMEYISLEKELEILKNYLTMQQLRFENKFEFFFNIDLDIDTQQILIPPMLTQPFVENAIEHGFKGLNKKGIIKIKIWREDNILFFSVVDNGIGIETSKKLSRKKHSSMALRITKERLQILNRKASVRYTFSVESVRNAEGNKTGTRVVYSIPIKDNQ